MVNNWSWFSLVPKAFYLKDPAWSRLHDGAIPLVCSSRVELSPFCGEMISAEVSHRRRFFAKAL